MRVIYIDSLFLINLAVNYLLVAATAKLCALPVKRLRLLIAALFGAVYAVIVYLPNVPSVVSAVPIRLAAGVILALIAFGNQRGFLRHLLIFFGVAACFAGVTLLVGKVSLKTLLMTIAAAYALIATVFKFSAAKKPKTVSTTSTLCVRIGEKSETITVLNDSGNALRDPSNGAIMPILNYSRTKSLMPDSVRKILESEEPSSQKYEKLMEISSELSPGIVPYRAMGIDSGLMLTLKADELYINGESYKNTRFAISPTEINYFGGII